MITDKMLEENTTPWGLLDEGMQDALMVCENLDRYVIGGYWIYFESRREFGVAYDETTVLRKRPLTKPVIPWDAIKDEYKWAARDKIGTIWLYEEEPKLRSVAGEWGGSGRTAVLGLAIRVDLGTCDWKDSLVERPK